VKVYTLGVTCRQKKDTGGVAVVTCKTIDPPPGKKFTSENFHELVVEKATRFDCYSVEYNPEPTETVGQLLCSLCNVNICYFSKLFNLF